MEPNFAQLVEADVTLHEPLASGFSQAVVIWCICQSVFSCACSLIRPHCSGCPFPSPHLKALGSATQGQARDRDSRAALGNPQDMRQLRQTYSGRSARVATRPESQAAPPHNSIFRDDCHLPAMVRLTGGYARCALRLRRPVVLVRTTSPSAHPARPHSADM